MTRLGSDKAFVPSRILGCTSCGDRIEVIELPEQYLEAVTYECIRCLAGGELPAHTIMVAS